MFDDKQVTAFAAYMVSPARASHLLPDADPQRVYHSDFENFLALNAFSADQVLRSSLIV